MRKPLFVVVALVLVCTGSWAATDPASSPAVPTPASPPEGCGEEPPCSITHVFSPGNNSFLYDFSALDSSTLRVDFVGGVLTTFSLTVTDATLTDSQLAARLDPRVFPAGTSCFHYSVDGLCHQYHFMGNAGGPNGVPVLRVDYNRPGIKLELTYFSSDPAHDPAFGHAPGESTTFSEDVLADYRRPLGDDTMCSDAIPGLSDVIALNQPLEENDTYCWVSPTPGQMFKMGNDVDVAFRLFASGPCTGNTGTPLRDRDARLSLYNSAGVFQQVRVKHFHFDPNEGVNRAEIDTEDLTPGTYCVTVRSDEFSPQTRCFVLMP